jgi:hypothetical protein
VKNMTELILYRAHGERGDKAEEILKRHNIDYEVSLRHPDRHGLPIFTMPRLETPYGTYEGEEEIEMFVKEGISRYFKKLPKPELEKLSKEERTNLFKESAKLFTSELCKNK